MTDIEVALPFWLDRPDHEATDVALAAADTGFAALWIGEMATYDAFALATSIGLRAYADAGADCVAVVPATAEDPGGRVALRALRPGGLYGTAGDNDGRR